MIAFEHMKLILSDEIFKEAFLGTQEDRHVAVTRSLHLETL